MADLQYPFTRAMFPESASFGLRTRVLVSIQAELSAVMKRVTLPGDRWVAEMQYAAPESDEEHQEREAFFAELAGQKNNVWMWHPAKLAPMGTLRGTPEARSTTVGNLLEVRNGQAGKTLLKGDMIRVGQQLFMLTLGVTIPAGGQAFIQVAPTTRGIIPWSAVIWDRPSAKFILDGQEVMIPWSPGKSRGEPFSVRFVEVY